MKIDHLNLSGGGRIFAISELHGHFPALNTFLDRVKFRPSVDRILLLGNFLGFVASSWQASSYLDKPWILAVMGQNEADVLTKLNDHTSRHQTLIGQWLPMMTEVAKAELHRALLKLPAAIQWDTDGGPVIFSQAPLPADRHWDAMSDELRKTDCPLSAMKLFMRRLDILGCLGRLGPGPQRPAAGVSWSVSGYSVDQVERSHLVHKNRVIVPSSARTAQDACYESTSILGNLEMTAFINRTGASPCQLDLRSELYLKKSFSTNPH
ncbi:serine/threonine protein phosphatase [Pseudomonas fluorescens]|uniref:serine/threonine protein phosphatase n=1 Tax=Pseudomonas fluorescens TaxID=294 RepID=UPI001930B718|nr:serine/threonine protein phosphatase [Pseudomonas fluorescens]MBD8089282.1 serine/threonine protein phosphatase [Pseudomonas fluorescens]